MKNKIIAIMLASMMLLTACSPAQAVNTSSVGNDPCVVPSSEPVSSEIVSSEPTSSEIVSSELTSEPSSELTSSEPVSSDPTTPWKETLYPSPKTMYITQNNVNARKQAVKGAEIAYTKQFNTTVTVIGETDSSYCKLSDGNYIHSAFLSDTKIEEKQQQQTTNSNSGEVKYNVNGTIDYDGDPLFENNVWAGELEGTPGDGSSDVHAETVEGGPGWDDYSIIIK